MPELPDVECAAKLVRDHCAGHVITTFDPICSGGGAHDGEFDERVFSNVDSPEKIRKAVEGLKLEAVRRKGKYVWWILSKNDKKSSLLFHFGMTGMFMIKGIKNNLYKSAKTEKHSDWPPKSTKMTATFDDGAQVAFVTQRRFAYIMWMPDKAAEETAPISDLAPDAYLELPSLKEFTKEIRGFKAKPIKGVLMDQEAIVSGLGTWTSDEVCLQSHIDPNASCSELSDEQIKQLHDSIKLVLDLACKVGADVERYPESWIGRHRSAKSKRKQEIVDDEGNKHLVKFKNVGGRKCAWVPTLQVKGKLK